MIISKGELINLTPRQFHLHLQFPHLLISKFPNMLIFPFLLQIMQKSPTLTPFFCRNHNYLTISLLPHQSYQTHLIAFSKGERRHTEGRAKGERTISVTSLNIKPFNHLSSFCIIRNKIPKTLHFPHLLIFSFSLRIMQSERLGVKRLIFSKLMPILRSPFALPSVCLRSVFGTVIR